MEMVRVLRPPKGDAVCRQNRGGAHRHQSETHLCCMLTLAWCCDQVLFLPTSILFTHLTHPPPPLSFPPSRWILPSVTLCFVSATLQGVVVGRDSFCPDIWEMSTPSTTSSALRYKQTHKYRSTVCLNTQNFILNSSTDPKDANYGKWVWDDACDRQNISIWWMFALPATLQISEWIGNLKDLVMHCIIVLSICNPIWIWFLTLF